MCRNLCKVMMSGLISERRGATVTSDKQRMVTFVLICLHPPIVMQFMRV